MLTAIHLVELCNYTSSHPKEEAHRAMQRQVEPGEVPAGRNARLFGEGAQKSRPLRVNCRTSPSSMRPLMSRVALAADGRSWPMPGIAPGGTMAALAGEWGEQVVSSHRWCRWIAPSRHVPRSRSPAPGGHGVGRRPSCHRAHGRHAARHCRCRRVPRLLAFNIPRRSAWLSLIVFPGLMIRCYATSRCRRDCSVRARRG